MPSTAELKHIERAHRAYTDGNAKRSHKIKLSLVGRGHSTLIVHRVVTHNGKPVADCRTARIASKVAKALDAYDAQRRGPSITVEEKS
jgi:hypothetical protein